MRTITARDESNVSLYDSERHFMPDAAPDLILENTDGVLRLTLNRPDRRNALSSSLIDSLSSALTDIAEDESVKVVVLAANGPAFCAGHDLGEMVGREEQEYRDLFQACTKMMTQIRQLPQPVIARVHAMATAAGCQIVAACDLAVAAEEARFATPGVKIGLFCTTPMVPLVRNIAPKKAMEMLLTGRPISSREALTAGLVNHVVPADELDTTIRQMTDAIVASSGLVVRRGKQAFYQQLPLSEQEAYEMATEGMTQNALCEDAQEGIQAFLEKRPPNWSC